MKNSSNNHDLYLVVTVGVLAVFGMLLMVFNPFGKNVIINTVDSYGRALDNTVCDVGISCYDDITMGYRYADCTWAPTSYCSFGCDSNTGVCANGEPTYDACDATTKCYDPNYVAYQSSDCLLSSFDYCTNGCNEETGACIDTELVTAGSEGTIFDNTASDNTVSDNSIIGLPDVDTTINPDISNSDMNVIYDENGGVTIVSISEPAESSLVNTLKSGCMSTTCCPTKSICTSDWYTSNQAWDSTKKYCYSSKSVRCSGGCDKSTGKCKVCTTGYKCLRDIGNTMDMGIFYQYANCSYESRGQACAAGCNSNPVCNLPTCTIGNKCYNSNMTGYQYGGCSWANLTNCSFGCNNSTGLCNSPTCIEGDKCYNSTTTGYQLANCGWLNLTTCSFGCNSTTNACTLAPVLAAPVLIPECNLATSASAVSVSDMTPRISYWQGKVNQHFNVISGVWETDPDGVSGADVPISKVEYCKKFYGPSIKYAIPYNIESITFYNRNNDLSLPFYTTKWSYACLTDISDETGGVKLVSPLPTSSFSCQYNNASKLFPVCSIDTIGKSICDGFDVTGIQSSTCGVEALSYCKDGLSCDYATGTCGGIIAPVCTAETFCNSTQSVSVSSNCERTTTNCDYGCNDKTYLCNNAPLVCNTGTKCKTATSIAYQNADCTWSNEVQCLPFDCDSSTVSCTKAALICTEGNKCLGAAKNFVGYQYTDCSIPFQTPCVNGCDEFTGSCIELSPLVNDCSPAGIKCNGDKVGFQNADCTWEGLTNCFDTCGWSDEQKQFDCTVNSDWDPTPRISYWQGKVNQHTEGGNWVTDPDGFSGADVLISKVEYCQKFYGDLVTAAIPYRVELIGWYDANNVRDKFKNYYANKMSYQCVSYLEE